MLNAKVKQPCKFRFLRLGLGLISGLIICLTLKPENLEAKGIEEFEHYIAMLTQAGVPNNRPMLEYLVLEIFYNSAYRKVVAEGPEDLKVIELRFPVSKHDVETLAPLFTQTHFDRASDKTIYLPVKCIRISGHNSYFCWGKEDPDAAFIFKNRKVGQYSSAVTALLYSVILTDKRVPIDFPVETMLVLKPDIAEDLSTISPIEIKPYSNLRFFTTFRYRSGEYVYPLHGLLNSSLLKKIAEKKGLGEFDWILKELMPELARTLFAVQNQAGMHLPHHNQNLWVVYNPESGKFHVAVKDLSDGYFNPLVAYKQFTRWARHVPKEYINFFYPQLWRINNRFLHENPRALEPSFNFISYGYQAIVMGRNYSFRQEIELFKAYFEAYMNLVRKHYRVPFVMSDDLRARWERLEWATSNIDLRVSIPDGKTLGGKIVGLQAFAELLMREIFDHINGILIGPRTYPKSSRAQEGLEVIYRHQLEYGVDICHLRPRTVLPLAENPTPETRQEKMKNLINRVINPIRNFVCKSGRVFEYENKHYEYTARHLLEVDSKTGEVISLFPRPKWFDPKTLESHEPICQQIISGSKQAEIF